jgi:SPP1 gp7 family putative phage head morphogenesis protein
MNLNDPTLSRSKRDDYVAVLKKIMREYNEWIIVNLEYVLKTQPIVTQVYAKDRSYDSGSLKKSLRTKITDDEKRIILRAIEHQMIHGTELGLKNLKIERPSRSILGQFINKGTLRELYRINLMHIESLQLDQIKKIELLFARFIGGGTITWDKLKKGIQKLGSMSLNRAEMIARTEVIRTISIAQKELLENQGIEKWKWITANDDRTCAYCGPVSGRIVELGEVFTTYKGEDILHPPIHPLCRCGTQPIKEVKD